jgi:hypothetical protein
MLLPFMYFITSDIYFYVPIFDPMYFLFTNQDLLIRLDEHRSLYVLLVDLCRKINKFVHTWEIMTKDNPNTVYESYTYEHKYLPLSWSLAKPLWVDF